MRLFIKNDTQGREKRVAITPPQVAELEQKGFVISVSSGAGVASGWSDEQYKEAGAKVSKRQWPSSASTILGVLPPTDEDLKKIPNGSTYVGFLDPFRQVKRLAAFTENNVDLISMDMVPRITRAQKMDALSSQANLAGYEAILLAASLSPKSLPMMMTAAGTIQPARVFVVGCGVAGLQAVATAKRLGARVEAFDTRAAVEEQVKSLGARFVSIDLGETAEVKGGYAGALSPEQLELQRKGMSAVAARSDIIIASAQVFGRSAPKVVTHDMLEAMAPGSVVIDTSIETGGNVEGSELDVIVQTENGVSLVGYSSLASHGARSASQVYSVNVFNILIELWDQEAGAFKLAQKPEGGEVPPAEEVIESVRVIVDGVIVNSRVAAAAAEHANNHANNKGEES